ncbi:PAS domain S-box protein [Methanoculleus sp. Wushi-C6]|uniref:PAS domain S-box protein n=1 Tax=Methanoculleus caldifontis TaxID=2651577 RepID=A0ABU3X240_9EURY|nr:PAS domain S-box protein [Methanoculleus sp. Wushi-C6]MDV2482128.1 PAS domain S-box protein [Methanoculleus sp. Wushi-C6]
MTEPYRDRVSCYPAVLDAFDEGFLVVSGDRKVLRYNPALARALAIRQEEAVGMDLHSLFCRYLFPLIEDEAAGELLLQALDNGADLPLVLCRIRTSEGVRRRLSISAAPMGNASGERLIRVRDVTGDCYAHNFMTALDRSPVVVFAQDEELRYIWSYNQQLGSTDASVIGMQDEDLFLPDEAARLTALKRRVLETGEILRAETTLTVGGESHVRDLTLKPLLDEGGGVAGVIGTAFDVTERHRAEEALQVKTDELKKRVDELRCLYAVTHLIEVPGITPDGFLQAVVDILPSGWRYPEETAVRIRVEDREYRRGDPGAVLSKQESPIIASGVPVGEVEVGYVRERPDAAEGPFLREERMLLDAVARRIGRVIERMQVETALQESEEKFRGIAQRSFDLIVTSYLDGGLNYISPAMERILGYSPEEMRGTGWEDYILPQSLPVWERGRRRVLRGEQVEGLQVAVRRKDGETVTLELNESPIFEKRAVVGFQAVGRDISERILYERLREQALDMTERNIAQFAVLADHVRHPLQVILGTADLLDDEVAAEKLREQVRRIDTQISHLDQEWVESRTIREFLKRYEL